MPQLLKPNPPASHYLIGGKISTRIHCPDHNLTENFTPQITSNTSTEDKERESTFLIPTLPILGTSYRFIEFRGNTINANLKIDAILTPTGTNSEEGFKSRGNIERILPPKGEKQAVLAVNN